MLFVVVVGGDGIFAIKDKILDPQGLIPLKDYFILYILVTHILFLFRDTSVMSEIRHSSQ